jgi:hypothetical protein
MTFRTAAAACVSLAALALAACNQNGGAQNTASQNGAYVPASADNTVAPAAGEATQPMAGGQTPAYSGGQAALPPRNEYQAVATTPPPAIPQYDQPPAPAAGYMWTPGYWDWSDDGDDYYWVPGTWVEPPQPGLYWTPGYWRFYNGQYLFSNGYWGPQVGFYGGVNYGYGYTGGGYYGGRWQGNQFYYNSQANNFGGRRFNQVYNQGFQAGGDRASYNGGPGGLRFQPNQMQIQAAQARHAPPTAYQMQAARTARAEPQLRASANRGAPPIAATPRAGQFHAPGVTAARGGGNYTPPPRPTPGAAHGPEQRPMPETAPGREVRPAEAGRPTPGREMRPPEAGRPAERPAMSEARPAAAERPRGPERAAPMERPAPTERAPTGRPEPQRAAPMDRPPMAHPAPERPAPERAAPERAPGEEHRPPG